MALLDPNNSTSVDDKDSDNDIDYDDTKYRAVSENNAVNNYNNDNNDIIIPPALPPLS